MSVKVQQDSYNKKLDDRINDLQSKINDNLNVANINNFDVNVLPYATTEYTWDNNAMVNGIKIESVKEMINYLKLNKVELTYVSNQFVVIGDDTEYNIEIPDNFDGRNSFVITGFNRNLFGFEADKILKYDGGCETRTNEMFKYLDGTDGYNQMYEVIQNKHEVKILCKNMGKASTNNYTTLDVLVLLWRVR